MRSITFTVMRMLARACITIMRFLYEIKSYGLMNLYADQRVDTYYSDKDLKFPKVVRR